MQNQQTSSAQAVERAKIRLNAALNRLDNLIQIHNENMDNASKVRTQVIQDIDSYIAHLENILQSNEAI